MAVSRNRRNTHAARALALRRSTARVEAAARRRLATESLERLHTVVVKVPACERRSFSDAVRSVHVRCASPRDAAASITGGTGTHALEARPGKVAPLAVLPGRVAVLDERSALGADVDAERWVFCPRCATRARFRGRAERLPDPGGVWIGDPGITVVVVVACRLCSPRR